MSQHDQGDKTEQPTQRKLEDAVKKGQIARSTEIQTVFVLGGGFMALLMSGQETWRLFHGTFTGVLGHLHDLPLSTHGSREQLASAIVTLARCLGPVIIATLVGALLAGSIQTRFRATSENLALNWNRINPVEGFKRLFSTRGLITSGVALLKLTVIIALTYGVVKETLFDPIFYSAVGLERIAAFMASAAFRIVIRVLLALCLIAVLDYAYQHYKTNKDLMMTKQEVKDEHKNQEGDPLLKAQQKARRRQASFRKMMSEVPQADVVITNPTRLAIAIRYDRRTMRAPKIVAKGSRLNAKKIREIAKQHGIPIVENKPLARLMFKYGKVGGEVPAQLYAAVAEVLAWVYRVNAYRYHKEGALT